MAMLRYYLNYENDEDLARGVLILFMPFRDEMVEIHSKDVKKVSFDSRNLVERNRSIFENYKTMTDLISTIQADIESNGKILIVRRRLQMNWKLLNLKTLVKLTNWERDKLQKTCQS